MKLLNLTPHPITFLDENNNVILELPGCDNPPRAKEKRKKKGTVCHAEFAAIHTEEIWNDSNYATTVIPLNKVELSEIENLPDVSLEYYYIVSRIVAEACPERTDLFIPDETVRDENGRIIGCRALAQV